LTVIINRIVSTYEIINESYCNNNKSEDNNLFINNIENINHNISENNSINTSITDSKNNIDNMNNIDSSNNIVNNVINSHSDISLSKWREVYYFLLGGQKKNIIIQGIREWNDFCKCQLEPGPFSEDTFHSWYTHPHY